MKASELMIGDIVSYNGAICRVTSTECFGNLVGIENDIICELVSDAELSPMPLTEEILEKNCFIQVEDGIKQDDFPEGIWQNNKLLYGLDYNHRGMFYTFSNDPEEDELINKIYGIFFVHDLQHCLRLCGLTELADNIKI